MKPACPVAYQRHWYVTSYAEVWIETGLGRLFTIMQTVTSYAEVWIETQMCYNEFWKVRVTSYAEVWIETTEIMSMYDCISSPPTRRCGLKLNTHQKGSFAKHVTSYAEVWIETGQARKMVGKTAGHLLRGGVD